MVFYKSSHKLGYILRITTTRIISQSYSHPASPTGFCPYTLLSGAQFLLFSKEILCRLVKIIQRGLGIKIICKGFNIKEKVSCVGTPHGPCFIMPVNKGIHLIRIKLNSKFVTIKAKDPYKEVSCGVFNMYFKPTV